MGNQFKKPFPGPEEQPPRVSPPSAIPEQHTQMMPIFDVPPVSDVPPQGYVQGQYGQYGGPRPSGQPLPGAAGQFSGPPAQHLFSGPSASQIAGSQQGRMSTGQPLRSQPGGTPVNSLFGGMQTPPVAFMGSAGAPFGGAVSTPNPAWGKQQRAADGFLEKQESAQKGARGQFGKKGKKKRRTPIWARMVIGFLSVVVVLGLLLGGAFVYYQVNYAPILSSVTGQQFARQHGDENPNDGKTGSVLNWGRINILMLGSDTDEKLNWRGNSFLAQTVIVVSIDTSNHDVDMLSIPRDYYINIPGFGLDKLDTAFAHGGSINNHMSGVGKVVDTLYQDFGIKINFFGWVGLQGFIKVIDTVHGVDVNVIHPIVDDTYPDDVGTKGAAQSNYKRVYISDGPQHLDGPTALEYVRSRHSTNDFDRSARQQQVLSALKLKLANPGIFGDLPQIAKDLQGSVSTNLDPGQLLDLGNFARGVQPDKIKHLTLGGALYSTSGKVKVGGAIEDVVYPRCDTVPGAINAFLHMTTAVCNVTLGPGSQPGLFVSSPGAQGSGIVGNAPTPVSATGLTGNGQALGESMPAFSDLFGMRDILDLMSMIVLDSPQV